MKKSLLFIGFFTMMFLLNINIILAAGTTCNNLDGILPLIQEVFDYLKLLVPILLIVMIMIDMTRAVLASDADGMKKAQSNSVKRLIAAVAVFFLPDIINLLLGLAGITQGTCGIN